MKAVLMSKQPEYAIWITMRQRCTNHNCKDYPYYGGRGIRVCHRWNFSFKDFIDDMGIRPSKHFQLDRIDNNGDYEPENCRWTSRIEQMNNTRSNRIIINNGIVRTIAQWAKSIGINESSLRDRIDAGWPINLAVTLPKSNRWTGFNKIGRTL
jgi:hypothetical protein